MNRRKFLYQAGFGALSFNLLDRSWTGVLQASDPVRLIVDADTANEVDDLYALAYALLEPNLDIVGITSAQWHTSPKSPNDSVGESQLINKEILDLLQKSNVPHPEGANFPMVNQWRPQPSEAARFIIEQARKTPDGEKLSVVVLGPATNLASAILLDPAIVPRISAYYLGFWHDEESGTWSKREFNTNNDPNAVDTLINTGELEFHVMTASTSQHLVFDKSRVDANLKGKGGIADYLVRRWEDFDRWWQESDPEKKKWIMWDVAAVAAIAHPELASQKEVTSPHDNLLRPIYAYTDIDAVEIEKIYWRRLADFLDR